MKFKKYDHVKVAKNLGPSMSHFTAGCNAIVIECSTSCNGNHYGLHLERDGECWWYEEDQLTLIAHNRKGLIKKWEAAEKKLEEQHSDLDWIFRNGRKVLKSAPGASIVALGKGMGMTNLWGSHGEGVTFYLNALHILDLSKPFLTNHDKKGWLEMAHKIKDKQHGQVASA